MAERGEDIVAVKMAIYRETGKYDIACMKAVADYREKRCNLLLEKYRQNVLTNVQNTVLLKN